MIVRRLAAFFTLLAFIFFSATWLLRKLAGYPTADVTAMFSQGVVIIGAYFMIGMFLAKMGIALVREIMEERRTADEEKRERARSLYLNAVSGQKGVDFNPDTIDFAASAAGAGGAAGASGASGAGGGAGDAGAGNDNAANNNATAEQKK